MNNDEFWTNFIALMPSEADCNFDGDECKIKSGGKEVTVVKNDNSFVVDGTTLHFEDDSEDIINTLLIPYVLQKLDDNRRI